MENQSLTGKTAVITGAGSGIGKAIANVLAKEGANTYILDFDLSRANSVKEEISKYGGIANSIFLDVSDVESVKEEITKINSKTGRIDILVNNAGIAHVGSIEQTNESDLDRLYNVNIKGVYGCMLASIPFMIDKGGVIINIASIASHVGIEKRFAYSMTKGAVLTMTYSVARDYIDKGIRCNSISPARIHTPFVDGFLSENYPGKEKEMLDKLSKTQPIGRMGKPEEVAHLVKYLCSEEASFVTGTDFPIDGGFIKLNN